MKSARIIRLAAPVTIITLVLLGLAGSSTAAPQAPAAQIEATQQIRVPSAQLRTAKQMAAAAILRPAPLPLPPRPKRFLTRLDATAYRELKAKAPLGHGRPGPTAPQSAVPTTPITSTVNFAGVDAATAGYYPPDTHGAAGRDYFVEVTNDHLDIYRKAVPTDHIGINTETWLNATPGYFAGPRLIYDPVYDRWIFLVTQWRTPGDPTHQYLYLAVSLTSDPKGDFYLYKIDVSDDSVSGNTLWDYPQLGLDRNAIIVTGDLYDLDTGNYIDSRMFPVAKSLLYNSKAFTLNLFTALDGTLAPPIVLDANPYSFLVTADWYTYDNYVTLYALQGSATVNPLVFTNYIPVPTFAIPPYALQPGTTQMLDTLDARFANASTQIGNSLFQVHTVDVHGYATPRFYEFNTLKKSVIQSGTFYGSLTSDNFNASIAANRYKDVFVTWSSTDTDPTRNANAQVRVSGRLHTDPPGVISSGSSLYNSTTYLSGEPSDWDPSIQRWGDYSAVSLDPSDPRGATAWIVNEYVLTNDLWGSRIGRISLPARNGANPAIYLLLLLD